MTSSRRPRRAGTGAKDDLRSARKRAGSPGAHAGIRVIMDPMTDFLTGHVVPGGAGLAGDPGLKASQRSTGGALSVLETSIGAGPPLHVHHREGECSYVLGGELSVRCDGDTFAAPAGGFVFLPCGRPHRFWSRGPASPAASRTTSTRSTPRPPTASVAASAKATADR